jgi:hypothetical protein
MAYANKQDQRDAWNRWYAKNKKKNLQQILDRKARIRQWLSEYKATLTCTNCGEPDLVCLQFHHRDPATKEIGLADAAANGWGLERLEREIEKCDVLCANCHLKEHHSAMV